MDLAAVLDSRLDVLDILGQRSFLRLEPLELGRDAPLPRDISYRLGLALARPPNPVVDLSENKVRMS